MIEIINDLNWKIEEGHKSITTPKDEKATFELKYKSLLIGVLELDNSVWSFQYSEEFKQQDKIKPLTDFRNIKKIYRSKALYPRFVIRLPNLNQPKVKKTIEREKIDKTNEAALLKRFGQRTIANPFQLLSV